MELNRSYSRPQRAASVSDGDVVQPRRRSAGFPVVPLRDAIELIVTAGVRGGAEHSQNAFATYLGHSTANSGPYRKKLAALRDWGLITRGGDRVVYTPLAREFIRAAPDHMRALDLLRQAFMNCSAFAALYSDSASGVPLDPSRLRTAAMFDLGVSGDSAAKFVDSFVDSVGAAGLGEPLENGGVVLQQQASESAGSVSEAEGPRAVEALEPSASLLLQAVPVAQTVSHSTARDAVNQVWPWDGGEISFVIRSSGALPASAFGLVGEIVTKAKALADDLRLAAQPASEVGGPDE